MQRQYTVYDILYICMKDLRDLQPRDSWKHSLDNYYSSISPLLLGHCFTSQSVFTYTRTFEFTEITEFEVDSAVSITVE